MLRCYFSSIEVGEFETYLNAWKFKDNRARRSVTDMIGYIYKDLSIHTVYEETVSIGEVVHPKLEAEVERVIGKKGYIMDRGTLIEKVVYASTEESIPGHLMGITLDTIQDNRSISRTYLSLSSLAKVKNNPRLKAIKDGCRQYCIKVGNKAIEVLTSAELTVIGIQIPVYYKSSNKEDGRSILGATDLVCQHTDGSISVIDIKVSETDLKSNESRYKWCMQVAIYTQLLAENFGLPKVRYSGILLISPDSGVIQLYYTGVGAESVLRCIGKGEENGEEYVEKRKECAKMIEANSKY